MSILGAETVTLRRPSAAGTWSGGVWTRAAATDVSIRAGVQPLRAGDHTEHLPEGVRARVERKIYTRTEIRGVDVAGKVDPDRIVVDGIEFEVVDVSRQRSIVPHYRAYLARPDEGDSPYSVTP